MKKRRVAVTLSLPHDMAVEYDKMARREAKNRSELFREMFRFYRNESLREEFYGLQRYGSRTASGKKNLTESDVEKIVFGERHRR